MNIRPAANRWLRGALVVALVGWGAVRPLLAEVRTFTLGQTTLSLENASSEADVFFTSMRFNSAQKAWNVEVSLANHGNRVLNGPVVLLIDSFSGTSGVIQPDGADASAKAFYDLSGMIPGSGLAPGQRSLSRTLTLGFTNGSPTLAALVYVATSATPAALALTRTLNEVGQPLPSATVVETGPLGTRTNSTDPVFGVITLGQASGEHTWQFSSAGRLPVWRRQTLTSPGVTVLPDPRLVPRSTNTATLTAVAGGQLSDNLGTVRVSFPPGSVPRDDPATLTPLTAQTLPAFLPLGWSPLQAFNLDLVNEPTQPLAVSLTLWGSLAAGETAAVVRWNPALFRWDTLQVRAGSGTTNLTASISGSGTYAVVVPDSAPVAPPTPQPGQPLLPSIASVPDTAALTAQGSVQPNPNQANRLPGLVTATATIAVSNSAGPLPSGLIFRGDVREQYTLRQEVAGAPPAGLGTTRHPPQYESFLVGYQRPGAGNPGALQADFPLRPLLLFGAEELDQATVTMDVSGQTPFAGGVLETNGGQVVSGNMRMLAGVGDLASRQAVLLRELASTNFADFASTGSGVVAAFELSIGATAPGGHLTPAFSTLPTNAVLVLARVLYDQGLYGLEPIERLRTDSLGRLGSSEPATGTRLSGLTGAGQFVLLSIPAPQGLVSGVAKNSAGQAKGGMPVKVTGQPWLTFSAVDGSFRVLAPVGDVSLQLTDPDSGDSGTQVVRLPDAQSSLEVTLASVSSGPRVVSVAPNNQATNVPRIASVVVEFDKPVNPATVVGGGISLVDANQAPVPSSLSLDPRGLVATLLPVNPLAASSTHTILVSTNVADLSGRKLVGASQFTFSTETDALNRTGGQFVIYEPADGVAPVSGTAGTADPESPVILVNDSTGETATTLSKPDGSFTNSIAADVEDLISAVLVNQNGTQTRLPASRQIFRDGSVGLFSGGGTVEAQTDAGPIQIIVDPGAIANKTKFAVQPLPLTNVLALFNNTPPAGGKLLGGLSVRIEGDPLRSPAQVRFPVDPASLDLPPGVAPESASYALTKPITVNNVTAYRYVDKMRYRDGHLQTNPGIDGSDDLAIEKAGNGNLLPISGQVISANKVPDLGGQPTLTSTRPVPGAIVLINPAGVAIESAAKLVGPGALVAVADATGNFDLLVSGGSLSPSGNSFSLLAISSLFPGKIGTGNAAATPGTDLASAVGQVVFDRSEPPLSAAGQDFVRPMISASHFPQSPAVSNTAQLSILATDDRKISTVTMTVDSVAGLDPVVPVTTADVTLNIKQQLQPTPQTLKQFYDVTGKKPLRANLLISAEDSSQNLQTLVYPIEFGGTGPILINPTPDPSDTNGPFVVSSSPGIGDETAVPGTPITINFNEPIDSGFLQQLDLAFQLQPPAGTPSARLSDDKQSVTLTYYALKPDTAYTLLATPIIQDINGNALDQNPYNNVQFESFTLPFKTAPFPTVPLPNIASGGGVVAIGRTLFALDRAGPMDGALVVVDVSTPGQPVLVTAFDLDPFPRDIVAIPRFSYKRGVFGPPETNDLLVIVGGTVAGEGQWMTVLNVSDSAHPQRIASTLATRSPQAVVTKLAWSPPLIGFLESDADITSVSLVNLQLFIYSQGLSAEQFNNEPANGSPGVDLNGDGDFVDPGESLPRPASSQPRSGLINGGLVASYSLRDQTTQRIYDFDLGIAGAFVGVVTGPGNLLGTDGQPTATTVAPQYVSLASGNTLLDRTKTSVDLAVTPKRLTLLPGVNLTFATSNRLANLALVTLPPAQSGQPGTLKVIDVTDPLSPSTLNDIPIPTQQGIPQSILRRGDGKLMLATSTDLILIDPTLLGLPVPTGANGIHPALVGLVPGMGGGIRSFVGVGLGGYAVADGGRNQVGGSFSIANLILHRPGPYVSPGAAIPEAGEEQPFNVIVAVNDDHDDQEFPSNDIDPHARLVNPDATYAAGTSTAQHPSANALVDNRDDRASIDDDDLVALTLGQLPPLSNGKFGIVEVEIQAPETDKPLPVQILAPSAPGGEPFVLGGATSNAMNVVKYRVDLAASSPLSPLRGVKTGPINLFLEGLRPSSPVTVTFRYLDTDGVTMIDQDKVAFTVAKLHILEVWADQFPNTTHNRLPNDAGGLIGKPGEFKNSFSRYPRNRNHYLMMGNRADDRMYLKASVQVEPDLPEVRNRVCLALYHHNTAQPHVPLVFGQSTPEQSGAVQALSADDPRPVNFLGYGGDFYYEHFVVGGFDYDGDGQLGLHEITSTFGTAYVAGDQMIFSLTDPHPPVPGAPSIDETRVRIKDDHVKIVNQSAYNIWSTFVAAEAGVGFAVSDFFNALNYFIPLPGLNLDVKSLPAFHLATFVVGAPTSPPTGVVQSTATIQADVDLSDNVGANFGPNGQANVPLFTYSNASGIGTDILGSGRYRIHLGKVLAEPEKVLAIHQHWAANPNLAEDDLVFNNFTDGISFDFEACLGFLKWESVTPSTILSKISSIVANTGSDCADVFNYGLGIGRANVNYQQLKVHIKAAPLPFVRGVTQFTVTSAEVQATLEDTYDWDVDINFPLAVIQAGQGTLGPGGLVFKISIPLNGPVPGFTDVFP